MKKQYCVGKVTDTVEYFIKTPEGKYVFDSLEEAFEVLNSSEQKENLSIYSREVSPWVLEGKYIGKKGEA